MTDIAASLTDVRVRRRWPMVVLGIVLAAIVGVAGVIVFRLVTEKPGEKACARIAELTKQDPRARELYDNAVNFTQNTVLEMQAVRGTRHVKIESQRDEDRCYEAFDKLESAMRHKRFTALVDCVANAKTHNTAYHCFD
jgi:hypothetical protein